MKQRIPGVLLVVALLSAGLVSMRAETTDTATFSVLSWNISEDAFSRQPDAFAKTLAWADADIVILDELHPTADVEVFREQLPGEADWNIYVGTSGGRQLQAIASRGNVTALPEFDGEIPYPTEARDALWQAMTARDRANRDWTMDNGIPVSGAIVEDQAHRLLVVVTDMQCCGDSPQSWQERRRQLEAREIRRLIREVLQRETVDGLIIAGDFNLVNGAFPLSILGGSYEAPVFGVVPAEVYHADGQAWTWDGRRTPFPNGTLDFQLYSPGALEPRSGKILDTENIDTEQLNSLGLDTRSMMKTGRHRPLLVEYAWR
ncbi:MAG: endonuclease/exonuclease/phosphatase family protein [Pseudomonadota bacterium]